MQKTKRKGLLGSSAAEKKGCELRTEKFLAAQTARQTLTKLKKLLV